MNQEAEILSRLLDGEPLDGAELARCFSDVEHRELLVDLALLRAGIVADDSRPSAAFRDRMRKTLNPPTRAAHGWTGWAVAAVLVLGLGLTLLIRDRGPLEVASAPPPVPDRTLSFSDHGTWNAE